METDTKYILKKIWIKKAQMSVVQGSKIVTIISKNNSKEKINDVWRSAQPEDLGWGVSTPGDLGE